MRIKPLEWKKRSRKGCDSRFRYHKPDPDGEGVSWHEAKTSAITYSIYPTSGRFFVVDTGGAFDLGLFESFESAKIESEKHYESAIMSSINSRPDKSVFTVKRLKWSDGDGYKDKTKKFYMANTPWFWSCLVYDYVDPLPELPMAASIAGNQTRVKNASHGFRWCQQRFQELVLGCIEP